MIEEEVDFSAYPVIRIDQIGLLTHAKLVQAIGDVNKILSEQSNSHSALHGYLQKQLLRMQKELDIKLAEQRVALVLKGLPRDGPHKVEQGMTINDGLCDEVMKKGELRNRTTIISRSAPNTPSSAVELKGKTHSVQVLSHSSKSAVATTSVIRSDEHASADVSIHFDKTIEFVGSLNRVSDKPVEERNSKSIKYNKVATKSLSSNISFNNIPAVGAAMDVVNKNFGSMFIVAATEKKKRYTASKKAQSSIEEVKRSEKLERRRQAMQRLLKRQEQRKEYHAQMRKLREEKKRKLSGKIQKEGGKLLALTSAESIGNLAKTVTVSSKNPSIRSDDSSDNESISGGDDDHGIVIDQNIIESVLISKGAAEHPTANMPIKSAASFQHEEAFLPVSTPPEVATEIKCAVATMGKTRIAFTVDETRVPAIERCAELPPVTVTAQELVSDQYADVLDIGTEEKNLAALNSFRRLKEKRRESRSALLPVVDQKEVLCRDETQSRVAKIIERVTFGLLVYTFNNYHCVVHPLEAWVWETSPVEEWVIDLNKFSSNKIDVVNDRPSGDYLTSGEVYVSRLGLVLLTKFILHSFPIELRDSLEFMTTWNRCISSFDCNIDRYLSYAEVEDIFAAKPTAAAIASEAVNSILSREVNVCANLHQYCEQLNSILVNNNISSTEYKFISSFISYQAVDQKKDKLRADSSPEEVFASSTQTDGLDLPSSAELGLLENVNDLAGTVCQADSIGRSEDHDDDLGCSDEESIMPVYEHQIMSITTPSNTIEVTKILQAEESIPPPPQLVTKVKKQRLSDTYTNIGMIFPVAYNQFGLYKQHGGDTSALAKALLESMHVQAKVYDEWMEVMSDYSTVFCEDREIREHIDNQSGDGSTMVYKGGSRCLHYRVKSPRIEVSNIIKDVFETNNVLKDSWVELPTGLGLGVSWNILWTWSKPKINMTHLLVWQKVNHFQDSKQLTRKDLLKKNIQRFIGLSAIGMAEFDIMPQTFILPHEYTQFVQSFTQLQSAAATSTEGHGFHYWIMKPVGLSRGRGIIMIKDLSDLTYSQESVVQRYIERPLCLDGYKFDLRLYIVVTSFQPLEAFIYRDGFARVSTAAYSLDPETMTNKFIHLTNSSIQKQNVSGPSVDNPLLKHCDDPDDDAGGSKISLLGPHGLWARLQAKGIDTEALWSSICNVVIKSLVVVDDKMTYQPCCFELFGYDVLIDSDLKPWLIEVNASPSLGRENKLDVRVKNAMIADIIRMLDPAPYDRAALARVLKRRLNNMAKTKFSFLSKNDGDLEQDLREILGESYYPRPYGQMPAYLGNYEMICPNTKSYERLMKLKKKMFKSN